MHQHTPRSRIQCSSPFTGAFCIFDNNVCDGLLQLIGFYRESSVVNDMYDM